MESKGDIVVFAQRDVGKVRTNNEDNFLVVDSTGSDSDTLPEVRILNGTEDCFPLMVCDGMGGAAAGEVASQLAVDTVKEELSGLSFSNESDLIQNLTVSLVKANQKIIEKTDSCQDMRGMGTTATLAVMLNEKLYIGQVGDSRAYILRDDDIVQVTKDQSYVNQLIEKGEITEEEADTHPKRNIILQALGIKDSVHVAVTSVDVRANDCLLICSDGLSEMLRKDDMKAVVKSTGDLFSACQELIEMANDRGGRDNVTVLLSRFSSEERFTAPLKEEKVNIKVFSEYVP